MVCGTLLKVDKARRWWQMCCNFFIHKNTSYSSSFFINFEQILSYCCSVFIVSLTKYSIIVLFWVLVLNKSTDILWCLIFVNLKQTFIGRFDVLTASYEQYHFYIVIVFVVKFEVAHIVLVLELNLAYFLANFSVSVIEKL